MFSSQNIFCLKDIYFLYFTVYTWLESKLLLRFCFVCFWNRIWLGLQDGQEQQLVGNSKYIIDDHDDDNGSGGGSDKRFNLAW